MSRNAVEQFRAKVAADSELQAKVRALGAERVGEVVSGGAAPDNGTSTSTRRRSRLAAWLTSPSASGSFSGRRRGALERVVRHVPDVFIR